MRPEVQRDGVATAASPHGRSCPTWKERNILMKTVLFAAAMLAAVPASAQTYNCHYNYLSGNGYSCNDMNGNGWGVTSNPFNGGWTVQSQHNGFPDNAYSQPYSQPFGQPFSHSPRYSQSYSTPIVPTIPTLRPPPGY
jgi:hypothetical protein